MDDERTIKIPMFGGYGIDVASISHSYVTGKYGDVDESSIEMELTKEITIEGITVKLNIVNTPCENDFSPNHYPYFVLINGMILVFDISQKQSIEDIIYIYNEAKECKYFRFKDVICAVAADKCHLRDEGAEDLVPVEEYKKLEKEFNCKVFETSTKTGAGIEEMFTYITKRILQDMGLISEEYRRQNDECIIQNDEYTRQNDECRRQNDEYTRQNDEFRRQNEEYQTSQGKRHCLIA